MPFKPLYFIFSKNPDDCLPYKWQQEHFQITLKKPVAQVLLQVTHKTYITALFYVQANLPQNLHYFLYTYAIIQKGTYYFFIIS